MKNWKKFLVLATILIAVVGCGAIPTLKNGEQKVASLDKGGISAENLYDTMKAKYGAATFIDLLDKKILDGMYKEDSAEKEYIKNQVKDLEESAEQNRTTLANVIAYYGFNSQSDFEDYIRLTYRRDLVVNDYVEKDIKDKEIKKYYEEEIHGDIKVKHILVSPDTSDDMTSEEKEKAESEAKRTAQSIIKKLNKGEDFDKLAKKYSDDSATAKKGGDLGWVSSGDMVAEFDAAAFKLKKGKYTTSPIKTTYGYHIIYKLDQKKKPKLKEVKEEILEDLAKEKLDEDATLYQKTLMKVREDAGLKFEDKKLKKLYNSYMKNQIEQAESKAESSN